jgi:hypothetical protein
MYINVPGKDVAAAREFYTKWALALTSSLATIKQQYPFVASLVLSAPMLVSVVLLANRLSLVLPCLLS